ncbi:MAG: methyltransferase domain-containing protein [Alphaproteobacteria bacterium]
MTGPASHAVLASAHHDESARERFLLDFRREVVRQARVDNRQVYEKKVLPAFQKRQGRPPKDRHEIRKAMLQEDLGRTTSALRLTQQEMKWDAVHETVTRQYRDLQDRAQPARVRGSLRLDPNLALPRYLTAVDIHGMPGNYTADDGADDIFAGAIYDRGVFIRGMGAGGEYNDSFGRAIVHHLKTTYPKFRPRRILDAGCSVGHSTLPFCDAYPGAEVHAIDIGAPMVRYGHARAESLGRTVHFSQQNAEATDFPDDYFDLIVGMAMLHETSTKAIANVFRDHYRILAPGGICLHFEGPPWDRLPQFDAAVHDWDTHFNAEPFIGKMHDLDPKKLVVDAGFKPASYIDTSVPAGFEGTSGNFAGNIWLFGGRK